MKDRIDYATNQKIKKEFYKDGYLKSALENDTQICGNIAALGKALFNRAGLKATMLGNTKHIWNLVTIKGETYCLDLTSITDKNNSENIHSIINNIKHNDENSLYYYMENPSIERMNELDPDENHYYYVYPEYMENKKYIVKFDESDYVLVGIELFDFIMLLLNIYLFIKNKEKVLSDVKKIRKRIRNK